MVLKFFASFSSRNNRSSIPIRDPRFVEQSFSFFEQRNREREIYLRASLRVIINVCLTVIALYKVNYRCSLIYSNDNINKLIRGMAVAK